MSGGISAGTIASAAAAAGTSALVSGALGGGGGSSGGTTQTVQTNEPWSGVQPYLNQLFQGAGALYGGQTGGFPGPYIAPESQNSIDARNWQAAMARDPHSNINNAISLNNNTISGAYLNSNPYLEGAVQQGLDQVKRNVSGQFSGANYGSSANQEWLGKNLANTALPIYAQNYANERQNQIQAMMAAPSLQMAGPTQLAAAGSAEDARRAAENQASQQQFQAPWQSLLNYRNVISGQGGGTSTQTSPYFTNPLSQALGMGLGGLSLYNGLNRSSAGGGWNPYQDYSGAGIGQPDFSAGYY